MFQCGKRDSSEKFATPFPCLAYSTHELGRRNGASKSSIQTQGDWEPSLMLTGRRVRKGILFLSLWRLLPYRPAGSQDIIPFHLAGYELKSESWGFLFGFSVCVGSGVKAEAGSGEGKSVQWM